MRQYIKYIILFVVGTIFLGFNAFHNNIWFDESYSMAIIQNSFIDVWKLTSLDVHPPLYYIMLKIFTMVFGFSIVVARIFSVIGVLLLALLGFTHLRKMFNDKIGFTFAFLTIFLPSTLGFAIEIRMYSWLAYFVMLTAIYAYKFYLNQNKKLIIPLITFTLLAAYTHYYGLLIAGVINLFLLIYAIKNKKGVKLMIIAAVAESVLYLPWVVGFLSSALRVAGGFWIQVDFNTVLNEVITFIFIGTRNYIPMKYLVLIAYPIIFFTIYKMFKLKLKEMKLCFSVILATVLITLAVSYFGPLFYIRYLFSMAGLVIFMVAYAISTIKNKHIFISFLTVVLLLGILHLYIDFRVVYNPQNNEFKNHINSAIQPDDIIISSNNSMGFVTSIIFPNNKVYLLNSDWASPNVCSAYPNIEVLPDASMLEDYDGRVWIICDGDTNIYDSINTEDKKMLEEPNHFYRPTFNDYFYIYLFEVKQSE